jgi:hypothetical protein
MPKLEASYPFICNGLQESKKPLGGALVARINRGGGFRPEEGKALPG